MLVVGDTTQFSKVYLPYGWAIRNRIYALARRDAEELGYHEFSLPHIVTAENLAVLDSIYPFSQNYMTLADRSAVAAGHEPTLYSFIRRYLQLNGSTLPFRGYIFGPVFRHPKSMAFPFNGGERSSFLECYGVFRTRDGAASDMQRSINWAHRLIAEQLAIPSICVTRPLATNKPVSTRTVCVDAITPLGRTAITGMSYFHDDIFTRAFGVRWRDASGHRRLAYSLHFGVSDNLFFAYLISSCDARGIRLLSTIAPVHVRLYRPLPTPEVETAHNTITKRLAAAGIRVDSSDAGVSQVGSEIRRSIAAGIPIQLLFYPHELSAHHVVAIVRDSDDQESWPLDDIVSRVHDVLTAIDDNMRRDSVRRRSENIVSCDTVDQANEILDGGRVATIPLRSSEATVRAVEEVLRCGEVLGFAESRPASDALSGEQVSTVAYLSRRT